MEAVARILDAGGESLVSPAKLDAAEPDFLGTLYRTPHGLVASPRSLGLPVVDEIVDHALGPVRLEEVAVAAAAGAARLLGGKTGRSGG